MRRMLFLTIAALVAMLGLFARAALEPTAPEADRADAERAVAARSHAPLTPPARILRWEPKRASTR